MIYDYTGNAVSQYPTLYGDGVHDDSVALQEIVDSYETVILPADLSIKITVPIEIDISKCKHFDGGNSTIIAYGDISAVVISGSLTSSMSANPATLSPEIINGEGSFVFEKCKISNINSQNGTGIVLSGCFKTNICDCYIHNVKTGIAITNQCRDIKIYGNHIYACWLYGLHFQNTCNLHQCNIENNIINYQYYCIYIDHPVQIANFQIVGNDIEVSSYPGVQDKTGFRCIIIDSGDGIDGQLSEIEIVGNTIQGHVGSDSIIEINGGTGRYVRLLTVTGNHISNCKKEMIVLSKVFDAVFNANSIANAGTYCFIMTETNENISITGNICTSSGNTNGGLLSIPSGAVRKLNVSNNNSTTSIADPFDIECSTLSDSVISGNIIAGTNTSVIVKPTNGARNMLANNVCASGTYDTNSLITPYNNI